MSQQQIRMATDADREALESIWDYCFHDGESFQRWYFSSYFRPEECLVGCVDGRPVASLQIIDLPTRVKDRTLRAGYIVGVDCLPEYRGMGFTKHLMEEAILHYAPAHDLQLLHLMPFEADFYEPFGFVFSDYHFKMDLDIAEFYRLGDKHAARQCRWENVDMTRLDEWLSRLERAYERCTARYDLSVERKGMRRWQALTDDLAMEGGFLKLLVDEHNEPAGLLAYIMKEEALFVREALASDSASRQAIYYYIASHRSQVKNVQWSAPDNEAIVFRRGNDKDGVRYQPFMMNYILDPMVLPLLTKAVPSEDLWFSVPDCGVYRWPAGAKTLHKVNEEMDCLTLDCRQLTQMVFDRGWEAPENHKTFRALAALFTNKPTIFNNEYF